MHEHENAVAELLGARPSGSRPVSQNVFEVELSDGRVVIAKRGAGPGAATAETAGLRWLAAGGAPVPEVYAGDGEWTVLARVEPGPVRPAAAERFGRRVAAMHASGAPAFGAPPPGGPADAWIGLARMRNVPGSNWPEWYARERIQPYLRTAVDAGTLRHDDAGTLEAVCDRLAAMGVPDEPPARLHGDLWNGNVLFSAGETMLIDPAAHGGHRETDLAMLRLFGCPHLERVLAAYDEVAPLGEGWQDRVALHQLYPLLVHTVLFGAVYAAEAVTTARRALALAS